MKLVARGLALALVVLTVAPLRASALGTFTDDDGNPHEPAIEIIAAAGITRGCNPPVNDHYCPSSPVSRGEMAAFLNRAFSFPATLVDAFVDDEGSGFEADINAIAAAGVTNGCSASSFCPHDAVTREQMAAFLVRALGLSTNVTTDTFTDDDGSPFEASIEALAQAGVTAGCTASRFCPHDLMLRDQMATFLARAIALTANFGCTLVIGFSQTEQWFEAGFEQILPTANWELLAESGGSIELWADSAYVGWTQPIVSSCVGPPHRVLLTITGEIRDAERWVTDIEAAAGVALTKFPSAQTVILQPVVGGPNGALCPADDGFVRASETHPVIDQAIAQLVAGRSDLVAGASPEVRYCADYSDNLGHLVEEAWGPIGGAIAGFYLTFS